MYKRLFNVLNQKRGNWKTEEEVRLGWIHEIQKELSIDFHAERSRSDASYNQVIIEFKDKGLFRGREDSAKFKEAIYERIAKYIPDKAKLEGIDPSDYIGIAIDGDHIAFAYYREGNVAHGHLMPLSEFSVSLVAEACRDSIRRAVTAENLIEDFGHSSEVGRDLMQILCDILSSNVLRRRTSKIKMLFEEWLSLYGQVADLSNAQIERINGSIGFSCTLPDDIRNPAILFVIHTYNSLLIKLVAAEVISELATSLTSYSGFAQSSATFNDDELIKQIQQDIEQGELYSRKGITGFVEEAIFGWYLAACSNPKNKKLIADAIREILIKLSRYRTDKLSEAQSTDVLKHFYQNLVPDTLRKSLGEFYTPDWLVDVALDKIEKTDWLTIRLLDPTCGSASFLLSAIRRIRESANKANWDKERLLRHIIDNVWGFDLNPLAVQTARVNFLIAIADLLRANPGMQVELPILLADAIYSPTKDSDISESIEYEIGSEIANLSIQIPTNLAFNRKRLDDVFEVMGESIEKGEPYEKVSKTLIARQLASSIEIEEWGISLSQTYKRVLDLHKKKWNGIWFRILRNFFWSATAGLFDVIVGNPPWVRWSKLPKLYRDRVAKVCKKYSIFSGTPYHGGNELDISGMITYSVADKWLKASGQLVFVITQTHFQSPSSQGFRSFKINDNYNLVPNEVDDLQNLKPFPDADNKTAILSAFKTPKIPQYPVPYRIWRASVGFANSIPKTLAKADIASRIVIDIQEATPVGEVGSPWSILPIGQFSSLQKLAGKSSWVQGRKGITCDLNGIFFVRIIDENPKQKLVEIETRPNSGKRKLGIAQKFWVEPDFLYPLLKGAGDIGPCQVNPAEDLYAFVPNKAITKQAYADADEIFTSLKMTKKYFTTFKEQLTTRSTFKTRMEHAPFYSIYNVGKYTFSPWKVVWAEQPGKKAFPSAVVGSSTVPLIGKRVIVPDHKIFFVDFAKPTPAYYLCGLLNSEHVRLFIQSHIISIQVGNIFKHMNLPQFDKTDKNHIELAKLTRKAHQIINEGKRYKLLDQISDLASKILFASREG